MDFSSITEPIKNILPRLPQAALILILGFFLINAGRFTAQKFFTIAKFNEAVIKMILSIATAVAWVILIVFILKSLGLTGLVIALSGSIVVLGLAIATGAKGVISDVLAGIFLSMDKDFNIGDYIKTAKAEGVVETIDIRKIRLRDKKNILHIIPNSVLETSEWSLLKQSKTKRKK